MTYSLLIDVHGGVAHFHAEWDTDLIESIDQFVAQFAERRRIENEPVLEILTRDMS
jgi:hypothetical protein